MAEEPNMIEIESTGNRTLDMYLTSLPAFLKAILDVIPSLTRSLKTSCGMQSGRPVFT